jgi:POT family proton-dependent oligopeptide transporter
MLAGLATFVRGQPLLAGAGEPQDSDRLTSRIAGLSRERWVQLGALVAVCAVWLLLQHRDWIASLLTATAMLAVGGLVMWSVVRLPAIERDRMLVALFLTAVSVVFWALFEQAGSSMNLFTERNVDRVVLGVPIQASQLQSLNPAFIILLAPVFSGLWLFLARRRIEPSTPAKFGLGIVQVGLGFVALVQGAASADGGIVALGWLVLAYFLHTTGELCLSPVGLAMVTKLSVPSVVGLMMGVWFLSSAFSHYVAGVIAAGASVRETPGAAIDATASLRVYAETFAGIAWVAIVVGIVVLLLVPIIRRRMH